MGARARRAKPARPPQPLEDVAWELQQIQSAMWLLDQMHAGELGFLTPRRGGPMTWKGLKDHLEPDGLTDASRISSVEIGPFSELEDVVVRADPRPDSGGRA